MKQSLLTTRGPATPPLMMPGKMPPWISLVAKLETPKLHEVDGDDGSTSKVMLISPFGARETPSARSGALGSDTVCGVGDTEFLMGTLIIFMLLILVSLNCLSLRSGQLEHLLGRWQQYTQNPLDQPANRW